MELTLGIIGAVTGLLGIIISLLSYSHNRIEAVNAYFENDRAQSFIDARRIVHNLPNTYDPIQLQKDHGSEIAVLIISYQQAAILVRKRQLPFWIFKEQASGFAVTKLFDKLRPYIEMRRQDNPAFAKQYEWLYNRIKRIYK